MSNPNAVPRGLSDEQYLENCRRFEEAKLNASRVFNVLENARLFMMEAPGFRTCHTGSFADFETVQSLLCGASCLLREMYLAMVAGDEKADTPPGVL